MKNIYILLASIVVCSTLSTANTANAQGAPCAPNDPQCLQNYFNSLYGSDTPWDVYPNKIEYLTGQTYVGEMIAEDIDVQSLSVTGNTQAKDIAAEDIAASSVTVPTLSVTGKSQISNATATNITVANQVIFGGGVDQSGSIKYENGDIFGKVAGQWKSLTQKGSGGGQWAQVGTGMIESENSVRVQSGLPDTYVEIGAPQYWAGTNGKAHDMKDKAPAIYLREKTDFGYVGITPDSGADRQMTLGWGDDFDDDLTFVHHQWNAPVNQENREYMRITGDGKVGVGTADPQAKFEVEGGQIRITDGGTRTPNKRISTVAEREQGLLNVQGSDYLFVGLETKGGNRNDAIIEWGDDTDNEPEATHDPLRFVHKSFYTDERKERMRIDAQGHVGIGTDNPKVMLEVAASGGSGELKNAARIRVRSTGDKERAPGIEFVNDDIDPNKAARIVTRDWAAHSFEYGNEDNDQIKPLMTISKEGNVGIGTDNPKVMLEVAASGGSGELKNAARIRVRSTGDKERAPGIEFVNDDIDPNKAARIVTRDWAAHSFEYGNEDNDQIKPLMTISKEGNVGIGEKNPNQPFEVSRNNNNLFTVEQSGIVRIGEVSDNDNGQPGMGGELRFSGGNDWNMWDSENSDYLSIARYNNDSDKTEMRVRIGDNYGSTQDAFVVGATDYLNGDQWHELLRVKSNGDVESSGRYCLNGDCIEQWPAGGGAQAWQQNNTSIYASGSRVGIGTAAPNAPLEIAQTITSNGSPLTQDVLLKVQGLSQNPVSPYDGGQFWVEHGSQRAPNMVLSDFDDPSRITFQQVGNGALNNPQRTAWIGMEKSNSANLKIKAPELRIDGDMKVNRVNISQIPTCPANMVSPPSSFSAGDLCVGQDYTVKIIP